MMKQMNQMLMTKMMKDLKDSIEKPQRKHKHVHKRSPTRKPRDYRDKGGRDDRNDNHRDDRNEYARLPQPKNSQPLNPPNVGNGVPQNPSALPPKAPSENRSNNGIIKPLDNNN